MTVIDEAERGADHVEPAAPKKDDVRGVVYEVETGKRRQVG